MINQLLIIAAISAAISQSIIGGFKFPVRVFTYFWGPYPEGNKSLGFKPWPTLHDVFTPLICAPCFAFWSSLFYLPFSGLGQSAFIYFATACFSYLFAKVIHKITF